MNTIELVTKYLPILDEQYRALSKSAILDMPSEFVQATKDAKKVKIAKTRVDKLGDYSRHSGFAKGYADLTWEEHTFTQDRGRAIQVDEMDNEETFKLAFGKLAGTFQSEAVIPELDAYRFSTYYAKAHNKIAFTVTSGAIMSAIDDMDEQMDEDGVPESNRILFVNPSVYKLMINDPVLEKHIDIMNGDEKNVNKKIYMYDEHPIIKVPSARFYTAIETLDGKTAGEEEGGYVPASGAKAIGMLMIQAGAVVQLVKLAIARIWAPRRELANGTDGVNPDADAWKFDYRVYHDAWVLDNKVKGIAAVTIVNDISSVAITSSDVTIASHAASVDLKDLEEAQLGATVVGVVGNKNVIFSVTAGGGTVGKCDATGKVEFLATGTLKVKATSVYNSNVYDEVTFTITDTRS